MKNFLKTWEFRGINISSKVFNNIKVRNIRLAQRGKKGGSIIDINAPPQTHAAHLSKPDGHRSRQVLHRLADIFVVDLAPVDRTDVHLGGESLLLGVRILVDDAHHRCLRVELEAEGGGVESNVDFVLKNTRTRCHIISVRSS